MDSNEQMKFTKNSNKYINKKCRDHGFDSHGIDIIVSFECKVALKNCVCQMHK